MKKEWYAWWREKKQVRNQEAAEVQPLKMSNSGKYKSELIIEEGQPQHLSLPSCRVKLERSSLTLLAVLSAYVTRLVIDIKAV